MVENGIMDSANGQDEKAQAEINKIHIQWLVRNVSAVQSELQKQTYLIYTLLIAIIGSLIGAISII